jgi:hypothetical protein
VHAALEERGIENAGNGVRGFDEVVLEVAWRLETMTCKKQRSKVIAATELQFRRLKMSKIVRAMKMNETCMMKVKKPKG